MATVTEELKKITENTETETPNKETLEACQELREGKGVSFNSIDELFKYLKS